MSAARMLVAGIGNIFLGDDAFGVEVVHRLAAHPLPESVRVVDFGIRGFDLAFSLLEPYELAILVDALPRGGAPGTLYVLEPESPASTPAGRPQVEMHAMTPDKVLSMAAAYGGPKCRVLVVGCEPSPLDEEADIQAGLSAPVAAAIERCIELLEELIARELRDLPAGREGAMQCTDSGLA